MVVPVEMENSQPYELEGIVEKFEKIIFLMELNTDWRVILTIENRVFRSFTGR